MDGVIDQIKQKLDVLEVLGDYIKLAKAGRNFKARCPFHAERSASFMVSPERQIWHCFGCGLGGDIFGFVMKIEGIEFGDALRLLARRAGVILKMQDPQVQSQKKRLYEVCELAAKFFETQLSKTSAGKKAHQYLIGRGMKPETIKGWRLGWAHEEWRALHDFLKSRGYKDEEIITAGLAIESGGQEESRGGKRYYDRFRSRIIFPIFDSQGQVIAFGGRIFGEAAKKGDMAKYLNSPQTPLYDKSNILYGLNKAKNEIRVNDNCIIVEGYMDLIMSHQAGARNAVASSGTALTQSQLNIIKRHSKNLAVAFDSAEAGSAATRRSIDLASQLDFDVKVILMGEKDPADIIKKNPDEWLRSIKEAKSVMDFYFVYAFSKCDNSSLEGKREIRKILLTAIKSLASRTEQSVWIGDLARQLRVDERDLLADMQKIKLDEPGRYDAPAGAPEHLSPVKSRSEGLEERLLGLYLSHFKHFPDDSVTEKDFQNEDLAQIFKKFKKCLGGKKNDKTEADLKKSLSPDLKIKVDYLALQIEQHERVEKDVIYEISSCLSELKVLRLKNQLAVLSFDIKDAQEARDKAKLEKLLKEYNQISSDLTKINN